MDLRTEMLSGAAAAPPVAAGSKTASWVPAPKVAEQFGVTRRTLGRWICDERLSFPRATVLNKRLYFDQHEINAWKLDRMRASIAEAA
jgi:predicted DNA-binding transcriptional regulator AlpA